MYIYTRRIVKRGKDAEKRIWAKIIEMAAEGGWTHWQTSKSDDMDAFVIEFRRLRYRPGVQS